MKSVLMLGIGLLILFLKLNAQTYAISLLSDSLKENAHCVIRDYNEEFELTAINKGTDRIKEVYTILDKEGIDDAILSIHYDKNSSVLIKQATLYDASGKKIRKVKLSEIFDFPVHDGYSMYSDDRGKFFKPDFAEYPYTVEYDYEVFSTNLISYGLCSPINDYDLSVEHYKFSIRYPDNIKVKKKELNVSIQSDYIHKGNIFSESWEFNNLKAIEDEPFDISLSERTPIVYLMPNNLIYDDYKGTADNWVDFGKWVFNLYIGRDELSEDEKASITKMVYGISDTIQKVKILYQYLQDHTRYVAITLGIGGFQPFSAKTVYETGYGDCKALSNYMHSLLSYIGVESYVALVSHGRYIKPVFKEFPNFHQFDHVILCVPNYKDTIWLECTDQKIPFGFLGDFTDDRDVLLITKDGGKFAHTKKYEVSDNLRSCNSQFTIDSTGTAVCSINTRYLGLQYDEITELLYSNYDEQKKWLYKNSFLPSLQINNFNIIENKQKIPSAIVNVSSASRNYCSFTGKYMLLPLNLINVQKPIQKMLKERHSDIIIYRSSIDYDTLIYTIPTNYKFEAVPNGKTINSKFGDYSSTISVDGNKIVYIRKYSITQGRYKPFEYKNFYDFVLSVSKADNIKVMLSKN